MVVHTCIEVLIALTFMWAKKISFFTMFFQSCANGKGIDGSVVHIVVVGSISGVRKKILIYENICKLWLKIGF